MRGKVYALFLLAIAAQSSTIDPNQVYSSNGVSFRWIFEDGRGYVAQDWQGEQISGLNYGFTPWLVDDCDSGPAPVTHDPLPPIVLPTPPRTNETPEPGTMAEILLPFSYVLGFSRRKGWRTKTEHSAVIALDKDAEFVARSIDIRFSTGNKVDKTYFLQNYEIQISLLPAVKIPVLSGMVLVPEIPMTDAIEIKFRGKPSRPLKSRLSWSVWINGAKVYEVPK